MKRAVITGATGAIGMALINKLLNENVEILVLTRKNSARSYLLPKHQNIQIIDCDLNEMCYLTNITGKQWDVFYHFAWAGTIGENRNNPDIQALNLKYTLDALELAQRLNCKTFIGAGSQAEYGIVKGIITPKTKTKSLNEYGKAKLKAGRLIHKKAKKLGLKSIWVRILSVYGPYDNPNTMIMSTIKKLHNNEPAQFTKAEQQWDYLFSYDIAEAFYLLSDRGITGKTYVLANGNSRPLKDYIIELKELINPNAKLEFGVIPYVNNQIINLTADISDIVTDTGWRPKYTFKEGIKIIFDNQYNN